LKNAALSIVVKKDLTVSILIVARRRFLGRDVAVGFDYDEPTIGRHIASIGSNRICR